MRNRSIRSFFAVLLLCVSAPYARSRQNQNLDREFQAAVSQYEAGQYAEAAVKLESLLHAVPQSFEVQELAGLVYSAQSLYGKASAHLQKAVELKPDSAAARTNLASNLVRLGKPELAEAQFKKALALEPQNFDANHNLGELYVQAGKIAQAGPFLEQAQQIDPSSYDNGYDLSLAYIRFGRVPDARQEVHELLKQKDTAELHNLLGEIEEADGQFVAAANEFELAAHADPSESNFFDWGSELLLHRTLGPAVEVFRAAVARYPDSPRLAIGLGMAFYARGNYDDADCGAAEGADLTPGDPHCYFFLSKAYDSSPSQANEVIQRFRRFAELQPNNARAQYYYAMSSVEGQPRAGFGARSASDRDAAEEIDLAARSAIPEAHLQLGNLYADQDKYAEAIPEYLRASLNWGRLVRRAVPAWAGLCANWRKGKAQQAQVAIYQRLREQHLARGLTNSGRTIRQFVYSAKDGSAQDAPRIL